MGDSFDPSIIKMACKPDLRNPKDFHLKNFVEIKDSSDLPKFSSMKENLAKVRNQRQLGCCSGAGTSGALRTKMNHDDYPFPYTPSILQLYHDARELEGTVHEDSGAMISDIFKVMSTTGIVPEDSNAAWSWPFSTTDDRWQQKPPPECYEDALKHKLVRYMRVEHTEEAIKTALFHKFPIVIGTMVYQSWMTAKVQKSGKIPMPGKLFDKMLGGHCTFIYGYGDSHPDYVDGQNSWGEDWGKSGRYTIPFKYLTDRKLCSDLWAIQLLT